MINNRLGVSSISFGFHRKTKLFNLNFFYIRLFALEMVKPTIKTIFVASQFAAGVWLLMKTLACNGSFLEF